MYRRLVNKKKVHFRLLELHLQSHLRFPQIFMHLDAETKSPIFVQVCTSTPSVWGEKKYFSKPHLHRSNMDCIVQQLDIGRASEDVCQLTLQLKF